VLPKPRSIQGWHMMPSIFTKVKEGTAPKLFWIVVVEHQGLYLNPPWPKPLPQIPLRDGIWQPPEVQLGRILHCYFYQSCQMCCEMWYNVKCGGVNCVIATHVI
jgi:hypothetical protein